MLTVTPPPINLQGSSGKLPTQSRLRSPEPTKVGNDSVRFGCCGQEPALAAAGLGLLGGVLHKKFPEQTQRFIVKHPRAAKILQLTKDDKQPKTRNQKLAAFITPAVFLGSALGVNQYHNQYVIPQEVSQGYKDMYYVSGAAKRQFPDQNPVALEENFHDLLERTTMAVAQGITDPELRLMVESLPVSDMDRAQLTELLNMIENPDQLREYDENFMNMINTAFSAYFTPAQIAEINEAATAMQEEVQYLSNMKTRLPQVFMVLMLMGATTMTGALGNLNAGKQED